MFHRLKICFQIKVGIAKNKNFIGIHPIIVLYPNETWKTTKVNEQKIFIFKGSILRKIFGLY